MTFITNAKTSSKIVNREKIVRNQSCGDPEVQGMAEAGAGSSRIEPGPDLDLEEKYVAASERFQRAIL